uniref:CHASE domain-containing protein n=1 Tax=Chromera velia CCMP2878 TaxID=1169474 RepID=A0A0G4H9E0_9ALVE|eukprot:Cvel_25240.t1-p1 / transcript=Cvel_25240.t1 / gene=Cvel_25240 / organism=Chromera_velia_CCMP2878 / gene_product=hypothetical protein / transcript_product=hypothetical protein / location=Cvel_scaffold2831:14773-20411(-) / protein_length=1064 / sequence_SO=supercontig / SO=protein_coding / is_pseudo=false
MEEAERTIEEGEGRGGKDKGSRKPSVLSWRVKGVLTNLAKCYRKYHIWLRTVALFVVMCFAVGKLLITREEEFSRARAAFVNTAGHLFAAMDETWHHVLSKTGMMANHIAAQHGFISRYNFRDFVRSPPEGFWAMPAVRAFAFLPLVPAALRDRYEKEGKRDSPLGSSYQFIDEAGNRDADHEEYFPAQVVAPIEEFQYWGGIDFRSSVIHKGCEASHIERTRRTGKTTVSGALKSHVREGVEDGETLIAAAVPLFRTEKLTPNAEWLWKRNPLNQTDVASSEWVPETMAHLALQPGDGPFAIVRKEKSEEGGEEGVSDDEDLRLFGLVVAILEVQMILERLSRGLVTHNRWQHLTVALFDLGAPEGAQLLASVPPPETSEDRTQKPKLDVKSVHVKEGEETKTTKKRREYSMQDLESGLFDAESELSMTVDGCDPILGIKVFGPPDGCPLVAVGELELLARRTGRRWALQVESTAAYVKESRSNVPLIVFILALTVILLDYYRVILNLGLAATWCCTWGRTDLFIHEGCRWQRNSRNAYVHRRQKRASRRCTKGCLSLLPGGWGGRGRVGGRRTSVAETILPLDGPPSSSPNKKKESGEKRGLRTSDFYCRDCARERGSSFHPSIPSQQSSVNDVLDLTAEGRIPPSPFPGEEGQTPSPYPALSVSKSAVFPMRGYTEGTLDTASPHDSSSLPPDRQLTWGGTDVGGGFGKVQGPRRIVSHGLCLSSRMQSTISSFNGTGKRIPPPPPLETLAAGWVPPPSCVYPAVSLSGLPSKTDSAPDVARVRESLFSAAGAGEGNGEFPSHSNCSRGSPERSPHLNLNIPARVALSEATAVGASSREGCVEGGEWRQSSEPALNLLYGVRQMDSGGELPLLPVFPGSASDIISCIPVERVPKVFERGGGGDGREVRDWGGRIPDGDVVVDPPSSSSSSVGGSSVREGGGRGGDRLSLLNSANGGMMKTEAVRVQLGGSSDSASSCMRSVEEGQTEKIGTGKQAHEGDKSRKPRRSNSLGGGGTLVFHPPSDDAAVASESLSVPRRHSSRLRTPVQVVLPCLDELQQPDE